MILCHTKISKCLSVMGDFRQFDNVPHWVPSCGLMPNLTIYSHVYMRVCTVSDLERETVALSSNSTRGRYLEKSYDSFSFFLQLWKTSLGGEKMNKKKQTKEG